MKTNIWKAVSLPRPFVLLSICISIIAAALPDFAQAQDWRFEPIVKFGVEYDDNATLHIRTDEEVVLEGLLLDIRADINYVSPTTSFFLQPRALLRNYPDEPDFDSDDYFLRSQFRYRGQSSTIGFRFNYDHQTVRTAERDISDLEIDDPDELTDDDTGLVLLSGTRNKMRILPYWNYQLSDVSSIGANIEYFDVGYADVFTLFLADYTDAASTMVSAGSSSPGAGSGAAVTAVEAAASDAASEEPGIVGQIINAIGSFFSAIGDLFSSDDDGADNE